MLRLLLKSKIHRATVTEANINYPGSITIDEALMEAVDLWEGEKVLVVDNTNGNRLFTYVMPGKRDSGIICMNGGSARLVQVGDKVTILAFALSEEPIIEKKIVLNDQNQVKS